LLEAALALLPEALASLADGLRAWLCSGACLSPSGAFVAWVDHASGRRSFEYPEISGYALTYLAGLESLLEREAAVGLRAGEWLVARVGAGNLVARDGWDNDAVYLFDLAMIASGLLSFGRRLQIERFIQSGLALVAYLRDELSAGGPLSAISRHGPASARHGWSTRGLPHLAKLSQAFLLAEEEGQAGGSVAARLIDTVTRLQRDDGRIPTDPGGQRVLLHPHLYAAEGLWIWGSARGDSAALTSARAALEWVWTQQLEHGGLPRAEANGKPADASREQSDVTAQAVRLALLLDSRSPAVDRALTRLNQLTRSNNHGTAIIYWPSSPHTHLNTWATLFTAQASANTPTTWRKLA
jgi:hypothetical protein